METISVICIMHCSESRKVEGKSSLQTREVEKPNTGKGKRNLEVVMEEGSSNITGPVKNLIWAHILCLCSFCY